MRQECISNVSIKMLAASTAYLLVLQPTHFIMQKISIHMKKLLIACLIMMAGATGASAQKVDLKFDENKKFKVVQFTDLHIKFKDRRSDVAFECMKNVIDAEKPNLIIITGDIIYSTPAADNMRTVLDFVSEFHIPFAITFGNHDRQMGLSNKELLKIAQSIPNCIASDTKNISGVGNYDLAIKSSDGKKDAMVIYCFDSHEDSQLKKAGVGGYDHIKLDQIQWYINKGKEYAKKNDNEMLPSVAYFHIPLPEFAEAVSNQNASMYGIRREKVCCPNLNSGLFTAMKEQGDVMGIFVGHDHDNDYAVSWYNILLAYGRFTGGPTEYIHIPNGARVVEFTEGKRTMRTWIRQHDGKVFQETTYPSDYVKD